MDSHCRNIKTPHDCDYIVRDVSKIQTFFCKNKCRVDAHHRTGMGCIMKRSSIYLIYSRPHRFPLAPSNVLCPRSAKPARKKLAKEHRPSSTVWMLDCYTPRTASVAHNAFLFALFSGGPTEEPTPLYWRFRGSGRWLIAASKSTFTLHQR